ncbi:MAG: protein-tyrosine phosphatase family protein [Bacteroidota bacterium]
MYAGIFWIDASFRGKLGVMVRPSGPKFLGIELDVVKRKGADILVSVIEDTEIHELGLEQEGEAAGDAGLAFIHHPIPDRDIPENFEHTFSLVKELAEEVRKGKNVVVHCRKSIGRSPMIVAAIMVWLGISPKRAFQQIKKARKTRVPDQPSQYDWVVEVERRRIAEKKGKAPSRRRRSFLSSLEAAFN